MNLSVRNNTTHSPVPTKKFNVLLDRAQKWLTLPCQDISLAIVDKQEMQSINERYRSIDAPTDVLSFDYGEIVLCPEYIKEKYTLNEEKQLMGKMEELFVHGLVHIGGVHHEDDKQEQFMQKLEEKILKC